MKANEIKKADNHVLITELTLCYAILQINKRENKPVKRLTTHIENVGIELIKRGLLTVNELKNIKA